MTDNTKWTIEPGDIEWEMSWAGMKKNGHALDKPDTEMKFEEEAALAHLLLNEQVFVNSHWWKFSKLGRGEDGKSKAVPRDDATWTEEESKLISVNVNCNDVFAWGCADAEPLPYDQIENVWRMWRKDPAWGTAVWCMIQRNQMPQKPVEDRIRKAGIWDLDALKLGGNTQDAEVAALFASLRKAPEPTDPPASRASHYS